MRAAQREKIITGERGRKRVRAFYCLCAIGNQTPYFSLTGETHYADDGVWRDDSRGCIHETLLEVWPDLAPLAALHLSHIDGIPMHAEANGWYWLAKAAGIKQRWQPEQDAAECARIFARHCRIDAGETEEIIESVLAAYWRAKMSEADRTCSPSSPTSAARERWGAILWQMRLRWRAEAAAAIQQFGLMVEHS